MDDCLVKIRDKERFYLKKEMPYIFMGYLICFEFLLTHTKKLDNAVLMGN